ncbi:MAG: acyl-CoA thioesterase [Bacteroidetes bacterium]|nr:acyl-CoA thioesterase [Bacteroidota bacterium]
MITNEINVRVRYAETDQMGYVYYGNYATYFEVARVELLRSVGFTYKKLEEEGIMLPVFEFSIKYFKPAFYDDLLTIKTTLEYNKGARIRFHYEIFNESGSLLNKAETTLVFIDRTTNRPTIMPAKMKSVLS